MQAQRAVGPEQVLNAVSAYLHDVLIALTSLQMSHILQAVVFQLFNIIHDHLHGRLISSAHKGMTTREWIESGYCTAYLISIPVFLLLIILISVAVV